jgi:hypothetical protein
MPIGTGCATYFWVIQYLKMIQLHIEPKHFLKIKNQWDEELSLIFLKEKNKPRTSNISLLKKSRARDTFWSFSRGLKRHFWTGVIQYLAWVLYISKLLRFEKIRITHSSPIKNCISTELSYTAITDLSWFWLFNAVLSLRHICFGHCFNSFSNFSTFCGHPWRQWQPYTSFSS